MEIKKVVFDCIGEDKTLFCQVTYKTWLRTKTDLFMLKKYPWGVYSSQAENCRNGKSILMGGLSHLMILAKDKEVITSKTK